MNCATLVAQFVRHMAQYNNDPLRLVVEIKGYRREDAKAKKATIGHLLGVWREQLEPLRPLGFCRVWRHVSDGSRFREKVEAEFSGMIAVLPESKATLAY